MTQCSKRDLVVVAVGPESVAVGVGPGVERWVTVSVSVVVVSWVGGGIGLSLTLVDDVDDSGGLGVVLGGVHDVWGGSVWGSNDGSGSVWDGVSGWDDDLLLWDNGGFLGGGLRCWCWSFWGWVLLLLGLDNDWNSAVDQGSVVDGGDYCMGSWVVGVDSVGVDICWVGFRLGQSDGGKSENYELQIW